MRTTEDIKSIAHVSKEVITVQLKDLIPASFQRELNPKVVDDIVNNFQISKYRYPCIAKSENEDGKYIVWDGQHRVVALRMMYSEESTIEAYLDNIGYEMAAKEFAEQDHNTRRVTPADKFKALVQSGDPRYVAIDNILNQFGLKVGSGAAVVKINAVNDIVKAYDRLGGHQFKTMLHVMQEGMPRNSDMWKANNIKGMTNFFEYCVGNTNLDINHLIKQLNEFSLSDTMAVASKISPKNKWAGYTYCVADRYNTGKRTNKIDLTGILVN